MQQWKVQKFIGTKTVVENGKGKALIPGEEEKGEVAKDGPEVKHQHTYRCKESGTVIPALMTTGCWSSRSEQGRQVIVKQLQT